MSYKGFLKQSTQATIHIGPFLDNTDGDTEENSLSITKADIFISKNNSSFATKNDISAAASDTLSFYTTSINATDTNTVGRFEIVIHKTGSLLCHDTYEILTANIFDSFILGTDKMQVDTREFGDSNLALTTQMKLDVNTEADSALATYDGPTHAELVSRTLASASYFNSGTDHIASVGTVTLLTGHTPQSGDSYVISSSATFGNEALATTIEKIEIASVNKLVIENSTGSSELFDRNDSSLGTVTGAFATSTGFTTRLRLSI